MLSQSSSLRPFIAPAIIAVAAGLALTAVSTISFAQSQPGTPSRVDPPARRDGTKQEPTRRDNEQQRNDPNGQPRQDDPRDPMMQPEDEDFFWREDRTEPKAPGSGYTSPFSFNSPQNERGFANRTQRLARMEERLSQRTSEMLTKLGEVRQLQGDRRVDALTDVLQQVLLDQRRMMLYLKQSRTAWAGEMPSDSQDRSGNRNDRATPNSPGDTTPARDPSNTPDTSPRRETNPR